MEKATSKTLKLSALYAVGNVARRGLHFALLPLYTSYLSKEDFGVLALLTVTGGVLASLITTPLVTGAILRFYYHPRYRDRQGVLVFNASVLLLAKAAAVAVVWLLLAGWTARVLLDRPELEGLAQLYAGVVLLWPVSMLAVLFIKLRSMARTFVCVSLAESLVSAGVIVGGLTVGRLGVYAPVWGQLAGMALATLLCLPVLIKHSRFRFAPAVLREPLRFGYPLMPEGLSRLVMQLGDRYVLRAFMPMGRVGLYSLGYSLSEVIDTAVGTPVHDGVSPTIRRLEADPDRQRRFIRNAATLYYFLAVLAGLALALFSGEIVMLFARRPEYWPCWVIIPVVTFAFVQQALGALLDWGMVMRNRSGLLSALLVVSAAANIALNLLLVPRYGIMGAAAATLVAYTLWNVLRGYFSARLYDLRFDLRRLGQITAVGVALYLLSLVVASGPSLWANVAVKALLTAALPAVCYATGALGAEQKAAVRRFWRVLRSRGPVAAARSLGSVGDDDRPAT